MPKLTLDVESLAVDSFTTAPERAREAEFMVDFSKTSCIERCTTSCVP